MKYENTSDSKMIAKMFYRLLPLQIILISIGSVNSIIDGLFATNMIGQLAIGATGMFWPISKLIDTIGAVMLGGSQILCGQMMGKNQVERSKSVFTLDILVIIGFGMLMTVLCLFLPDQISSVLGAHDELQKVLSDYICGYSFGMIPLMLGTQLAAFMQVERQEKRTYFGIGAMLVVNIITDYIFVAVLKWGTYGLGIATSISNWVFFVVLGSYYFTSKVIIKFDMRHIILHDIVDIVRIGAPGAVGQLCLAIRGQLMNRIILNYAGENGISAFSAINTFGGFYYATTAGVAAATRLLVSIYVGEEDKTGVVMIMKTALTKGVGIVAGAAGVFMLLALPLTYMFFRPDAGELFEITKWGFIIFPMSMPLSCIYAIYSNYYQCLERIHIVNILSVFDGVLALVGCSLLLAPIYGMMGVWYSQVLGGVITAAVILIYIIIYNKKFPTSFLQILTLPKDFGIPVSDRIDITVRSIDEVTALSTRIMEFCDKHGVDSRHSNYAGVSMEEMAVNIIKHGFNDGKKHSIDIRVAYKGDKLILRIKDDCRVFNPKEAQELFDPADITHNIGIRMVSRLAKSMVYQNTLGMNVLTITI